MDERRLRERVHAALQAADSGLRQPRTPAFAALWQSAQQPVQQPTRWRARALAASLAVIAIVAFFALRLAPIGDAPGNAADPDLVLAQQLSASDPWRVPTDRLLEAAPASLASGAPSIPEFQYPLLPKERYL
jgi:hypothetical protein